MVEMEESEPRRRDTFTSLQLQRAADQLQDAIQSVRQRRSMHSSRSTCLSLLSDSSGDEVDEDQEDAEDDDQENRRVNGPSDAVLKPQTLLDTPSKLHRFSVGALASERRVSGGTLSLKDLRASPLRPPRDLQTAKQRMHDDVKKPVASAASQAAESTSESIMKSVDVTALKALAALQTELEDQAKTNRAMQEQIKDTVGRIDAFVSRMVGCDEMKSPEDVSASTGKLLTAERLAGMSDEWIHALERWKATVETERDEPVVSSQLVEEGLQRKIEEREETHKTELEALELTLAATQNEMIALKERIDSLLSAAKDAQAERNASERVAQQHHEWSQIENEDLRSHLVRRETEEVAGPVDEPSAEQQQRHVLNLLAQLKQAELRELRWEILFEEQCQETSRTKERLAMLLEDERYRTPAVISPSHPPPSTASSTMATSPRSPRARRASFASSTTSSELQLYQQRIEFLEDHLRDVREQINCDHHQFLYEQQKWEVEKKSMGHEVEEVHGVSVKVLKLLLIREKLLKRQEVKLEKRVDKLKHREQLLQQNQQLLQASLETTMQECAVGLLYVRQLAMMPPTGERTGQESSPVKPVKLVRLLKKLKNLQLELGSGGFGESCSGSRASTAAS